jgi:hypothetical protein
MRLRFGRLFDTFAGRYFSAEIDTPVDATPRHFHFRQHI